MEIDDSMSDRELVASISADDGSAFAELYKRYFGLLYLHALKKLRDKDEPKDSVWLQDCSGQGEGAIIPFQVSP
ncbi:MAG: hypothetical protein JKY70_17515 [Mucilaginibacter sp.]|nr:hypothetical protein [Mucilaginibacter sp.]